MAEQDIERRLGALEESDVRQWKEITSMQNEIKQRLVAVETEVRGLGNRIDRHNGSGQRQRFEQMWGGLKVGAWAIFIAVLTAGTVVAALEYLA